MESFIQINHLSKTFGDHNVLKDISLEINKGEVVAIIGSSGSGKSTLLRCINLLEEPTSGDILIKGKSAIKGEIDKEQLATEYVLNVFASNEEGYKQTIIKPVNLDEIKDNGSKTIPNKIIFDSIYLIHFSAFIFRMDN